MRQANPRGPWASGTPWVIDQAPRPPGPTPSRETRHDGALPRSWKGYRERRAGADCWRGWGVNGAACDPVGQWTNQWGQARDISSLVGALQLCEQRKTELRDRLAALANRPRVSATEPSKLAGELRGHLEDWRGLLRRQVSQPRQILRKVLDGKLVFTPRQDERGRYYEFKGTATLGHLLGGIVYPGGGVSPGGYAFCIRSLDQSYEGSLSGSGTHVVRKVWTGRDCWGGGRNLPLCLQ